MTMTNGEAKVWLEALRPMLIRAHETYAKNFEIEDLFQEAWIKLHELLNSGKLDQQRNVIAFVRKAVHNRLKDLERLRLKDQRTKVIFGQFIDSIKSNPGGLYRIDLVPDLKTFSRRLSRSERQVFNGLAEGHKRADLMREHDLTASQYAKALRIIRSKTQEVAIGP